jgi:hypothetical protein
MLLSLRRATNHYLLLEPETHMMRAVRIESQWNNAHVAIQGAMLIQWRSD